MIRKSILFLLCIAVVAAISVSSAAAYTINGDISDWQVYIDGAGAGVKGYLNGDLPSGGNDIDFWTEDNAAANIYGWQTVGPGSSYGDNTISSSYYHTGNYFDAEAIYFDNDGEFMYIAIVHGLPPTGGTAPGNPWFMPGDIAIDIDNDNTTGSSGYEYAIATINHGSFAQGSLYAVSAWDTVYYSQYSGSNPYNILTGNEVSANGIEFVYTTAALNSHYVMEAKLPLSIFNLDLIGNPVINLHWTQGCGNDVLNLAADLNPVPEPASLFLLGSGLLGLLAKFRLRKRF